MWIALALVACGRKAPPESAAPPVVAPAPAPAPAAPAGPRLSGTASWYGKELAGRPTASGIPFDPSGLTAAHRTLPFGTIVRVTRTDTGAEVTVVVNDRGPFGNGRMLDVSEAAAEVLGMITSGTAPVKLTVLGCDPAFPACR